MSVKKIAFTVIPVSDVSRSLRFYEDAFGLKHSSNWENRWAEFDIGSGDWKGTVALASGLDNAKPGAQGTMLALEVSDIDGLIARFRGQGVKVTMEPFSTPVCRMAAVADPDGNNIVLHQLTE